MTADNRFKQTINAIKQAKQVWILVDEHGCVMLNSDDEDCVPVWSSQQDAQAFAVEEWQHCQAKAIKLSDWRSRWSRGLEQDDLAVVVHPDNDGMGVVVDAMEFDFELSKR
ncbi:DUF2750 domain-containing protein [Paraferrimonas haliotis]|uniref:DUF2750 domain-containing protein n=1 Tax=Paraferrimonas haliotis TaxID=2013866 RepID=A0AA37TP94_9GAMM|nr:DUF2750 domain-containing protein [Paraferrimonas haliotis]GLS83085.1 hypothetical protein GCM10007894_10620 [Paraferrimonas haliotis]